MDRPYEFIYFIDLTLLNPLVDCVLIKEWFELAFAD